MGIALGYSARILIGMQHAHTGCGVLLFFQAIGDIGWCRSWYLFGRLVTMRS